MNYIPGFSNYLETTVPDYGPASIMDVEPVVPQRAAVAPMTQEAAPTTQAVAPYSLSGLSPEALAGLYALSANNTGGTVGSGITGLPSLGAGYVPQFEEKLITAPVSNKGNATAYSGMDNQFYMSPNDFVRLVDRGTNTVVFEGTGYEAAQKAVEMGQNMTDTMGRKANYQIETGKTQDSYAPVANEKYNKTTAGNIANAVGTALPLAMALIPGANLTLLGSKLAAGVAAGTLIGGASAGLKGDNILKGAAIGGLSAAGGQALGPIIGDAANVGLRAGTAIGTGIGSTAGGVLTGQNLKNALLGGVVSGGLSYLSPDITKGLGIGGGSSANTSTSGGGGGDIVVSGYRPTSIGTSLGGSQNKIQQALKPKTEAPYDGLTVTGGKFGSVGFGGDQFGAPGNNTSAFEKMYSEPYDPNEILVKASPLEQAVPISVPVTGALPATNPAVLPDDIVVDATKVEQPASVSVPVTGPLTTTAPAVLPNDIVVDATTRTTPVSSGFNLSSDTLADIDKLSEAERKAKEEEAKKKKLGLEEYLRLASLATGLLGNAGGKGGSGSSGTYGGAGSGRLNPIFSAQLPAAGALGTVGATRTARPLGDVDWLTYGTRPELKFFDYATQPTTSAPVTSPVPGNPAGPIMAEDKIRHSEEGIPLWMQLGLPNPNAPATQAAGPIMQERGPMAMFEGGTPSAKHGDQSRRTEFAVNGPGTGRSDDIPAVLSDGEYVIDAETVALLGDGSSKAGAKKLDDLRVKVRKHKGQKLAKGRFSANAKKPEAYLSGGRI